MDRRFICGALLMVTVTMAALVLVEGGRRGGRPRGDRGCNPAEGPGGMSAGVRFIYTVTGNFQQTPLNLSMGAFAPRGNSQVHVHPMTRGFARSGLSPARIMLDYTDDQNSVAVIKTGRPGNVMCVVVNTDTLSDSTWAYSDVTDRLFDISMTSESQESVERTLSAQQTEDPSQFGASVRNFCDKDRCGRPLNGTTYYTTQESSESGASGSTFLIIDDLVTITGLPNARQQRQQRRQQGRQHGRNQDRATRRQMRRQRRLEAKSQ